MKENLNLELINTFFDKFFDKTVLDNKFIYILMFVVFFIAFAYLAEYILVKILKIFVNKTENNYDNWIVGIIQTPIFYTILYIGFFVLFFSIFEKTSYWKYIYGLITTILLFIWIVALVDISKILVEILSKNKRIKIINYQTKPLFRNLFVVIIYTLGIYIIFASAWNIDMTAFIASLGVVGIAVGFAAKDTLANLFSGVFIIVDKPYKVGDFIILDSGERGKVSNIGIRSTRLLTGLKTEITIPNSVIGNAKITNESEGEGESFILNIPFYVSYGEDINKVQKIVEKIVVNKEFDEYRVLDVEPIIRFTTMGASSLDFNLYITIKKPTYKGIAKSILNSRIYEEFTKQEIEIPYTKQDLYIKEMPKK